MNLAFATRNQKKSKELKTILQVYGYNVLNLNDSNIDVEINETGHSFRENAMIKARHLYDLTGNLSLGEDSGLEVKALHGRPGIFSARYSGQHGDDQANLKKLLEDMRYVEDRAARFKTVIALYDGREEFYFEGVIIGTISTEPKGSGGFGYDPVFIPEGHFKSFAEFSASEKNEISHRAKAVQKLAEHLKITRHPR